jgi:tetratricopeptide (TPR) repeat protein
MNGTAFTVSAKSGKGRVLLAAALITAAALAWFGVRWQLGTMLAELNSPSDPGSKHAAELARGLTGNDPLAAWLFASANRDFVSADKIDSSVAAFENVVRLSPNDYRWWIELGRAEEQASRNRESEESFRRATELSPAYAYPRWQLGNFLLRRGRTDEAFAELRKAAENNATYREQVFSLAWDYFDHDPRQVEALAADTPDSRVSLAFFYAARAQAADSLRIWNTLDADQKSANSEIAKTIAQAFTEKKFFRQGLEFSRQIGIDSDAQPEAVTNPGFEKPTGSPDDNHYGWNLERGDNKLDINTDSAVKHGGNRSLKINFRTFIKPQLANPWQIVAVRPGGKYTLRFWMRTENLRSAGMPMVEVVDASEYRLLATSPPAATGTNDWKEATVDFQVPESVDGVVIRLARSYCGDACPLVGILWLDDFSLENK